MSDLLDLANQYYAVAADMRHRGEHLLSVSAFLSQYADALCEQNVRNSLPPNPETPVPPTEQSTP